MEVEALVDSMVAWKAGLLGVVQAGSRMGVNLKCLVVAMPYVVSSRWEQSAIHRGEWLVGQISMHRVEEVRQAGEGWMEAGR
jgi:hypothetical protein